jgi:hypothetical protein
MGKYIESYVRTDKLHCSNCLAKIRKGDNVIFELNKRGKMENVFGERCLCKNEYLMEAIDYETHPFSSEGLGQE